MTRNLVLVDPDPPSGAWAPFAGARPIAELRAGAHRIWERWVQATSADIVSVIAPHAAGFADVDSIPVQAEPVVGPALVARSTWLPLEEIALPADARGITDHGRTVAWRVPAGETWRGPHELADGAVEKRGFRLDGVVSLISAVERLLEADCVALADDPGDGIPSGVVVIGDPARVVVRGASVEPQAIFDVRKGPIVIEQDAVVRAGVRLEGPLYVGPHSWILGGAIRHSSIGPHCRVHGEVSNSVFLGYANKSHDGFLGHSVLGHWVNLGAGTITSNLKNTYGEIRLALPEGPLQTGRNNVGTLFGDHVKTAIGTLLPTGTVLGTGANILGGPVPRYVAPFAWGGRDANRLDRAGFLRVAERVLPRRGVEVTAEVLASLTATYQRLTR
ncbi:MAG: hypothetical protein AB7R55_21760 [Gemmatimonadales bacterium]